MTNEKSRIADAIRGAGYAQSARLESVTEPLLARLPKRKARTKQDKLLMVTAMAAALLVFFAFGMPKVVQAAQLLIDQLFNSFVQEEAAYQALPMDAKLEKSILGTEMHYRGHAVDASTVFDGVTITLPTLAFAPEEAHDPTRTDGYVSTAINFSKLPQFDPNYVDFTLSYGGKDYPMKLDDDVMTYREHGQRALTEEDWLNTKMGWYSNSQLVSGTLTTYLFFPVDDWILTAPTDMVLRGTVEGGTFEIAFTFDPAQAHALAVSEAANDVEVSEEMAKDRQQTFESMESKSTPIGIIRSAKGVTFQISELAVDGDRLNFGWVVNDVKEKNPKIAGLSYYLNRVVVDGFGDLYGTGGGHSELTNSTLRMINYTHLGRDMSNLPDVSLFVLDVDLNDPERPVRVAFRYRWADGAVTLPVDDAQEAAWIAESDMLEAELAARSPKDMDIDLSQMNLTQEKAGLTMTVLGARIESEYNLISIQYRFERGELDPKWRLVDGYERGDITTLTVNGKAAHPGGEGVQDGMTENQFFLSHHITELGDRAQCTYALTAIGIDDKGDEVFRQPFSFDFTLDLAQ